MPLKNRNNLLLALIELNPGKVTDMVILKFNPDYSIAGASAQHKNADVFHSPASDYHSQQFNEDKIQMNSNANLMRVLPGQPGYVMIYEYFGKDNHL